MINIGILGANSPEAGELIRLLIHHPDVKLQQVSDSELIGCAVADLHHGLIGETDLRITRSLNYEELDIVFLVGEESSKIVSLSEEYSQVSFIAITPAASVLELCKPYALICDEENITDSDSEDDDDEASDSQASTWADTYVYGVPELNRKPLVRGARRAIIPSAFESLLIVSLLPLLVKKAVPTKISVVLSAGESYLNDLTPRLEEVQQRLTTTINTLLEPKHASVAVSTKSADYLRGMRIRIAIPYDDIYADVIRKLYQDSYSDHHMTFIASNELEIKEVEGTNNCLISIIENDNNGIIIDAIADARLRGGAGEAVHVMNLFAGLFEKTGLNLKVSNF